MGYFIYKLFNKQDELLYAGQTENLCQRFSAHFAENNWKTKEIFRIEYAECQKKIDLQIYELYYINILNPKYNKAFAYNQIPSFELKELEFKNYNKCGIKNKNDSEIPRKYKKLKITDSELHNLYISFMFKNANKINEISYDKGLPLYTNFINLSKEEYDILHNIRKMYRK